ncbi:hypothetical protein [Methanoplanus endosymbiosus]|uniref:Uncharacterized protein n=1 Tax=Methanoplanus endosymbiosus TaxID=33865 RepID=A0A9E7PMC5_9EURY|nr:hypothetical protein [Methanoplanus endosymbiosus]UUX92515.1 hypothetical protein L6E24_14465 [Methanoplanus endosymbiosus]
MKKRNLLFYVTVLISAMVAFVGAATPVYCPDNPKCSDINCTSQTCCGSGCPGESFKIDGGPYGGIHDIAGTNCYVDIDMFTSTHFTFTSNAEIYAVIVKGGPNSNVYFYDPPVYFDSELLSTPVNPANGKYYDISHIEFCYDCRSTPVPEFPGFFIGIVMTGCLCGVVFLARNKYLR